MSVEEEKASLRQNSKNDRMNISHADREVAERAIAQHVVGSCKWWCEACVSRTVHTHFHSSPPSIALYAATHGEVHLHHCFPLLIEGGWSVLFPRIEATGRMNMHHTLNSAELQPGAFGISEPPQMAPLVSPQEVDVILVPGLAFTRDGRRLGYGGGYYDRYLALCRTDCLIAGVAFERQVRDDLPAEPHDVKMDVLITERGVVSCETGLLQSF